MDLGMHSVDEVWDGMVRYVGFFTISNSMAVLIEGESLCKG